MLASSNARDRQGKNDNDHVENKIYDPGGEINLVWVVADAFNCVIPKVGQRTADEKNLDCDTDVVNDYKSHDEVSDSTKGGSAKYLVVKIQNRNFD